MACRSLLTCVVLGCGVTVMSNRPPGRVEVAPPHPEPHAICGGSYGWFDEKPWSGRPCPPPSWEPVWALNRSTTPWTPWGPEIAEGNTPGFVSPVNASRWGWVNFDWSDASRVWQDEEPHMNEQVSTSTG